MPRPALYVPLIASGPLVGNCTWLHVVRRRSVTGGDTGSVRKNAARVGKNLLRSRVCLWQASRLEDDKSSIASLGYVDHQLVRT